MRPPATQSVLPQHGTPTRMPAVSQQHARIPFVHPDRTIILQQEQGEEREKYPTETAAAALESGETDNRKSIVNANTIALTKLRPQFARRINSNLPNPKHSSRSEVEISRTSSQAQGFGIGQESPDSVGNGQSSSREVWEAPSAPASPSRKVLYKAPNTASESMAPATPGARNGSVGNGQVGPHPSFIQVANPYIFEQKLQDCFTALGTNMAKEDRIRLDGVLWIDNVRKALQLPVRTFNTAVMYYHKFRLVHADAEYIYIDAAAAALFTACKIEDTLKKSREILCAAYNMKLSMSDQISSDDQMFEQPSKTIVGLERLMLESAGFDFRNRHPQRIVVKLFQDLKLDQGTVGKTAYNMCIDVYRTFAPLKQTAPTVAIVCVELAARIHGADLTNIVGESGIDYKKWSTSRTEVMETLRDLLDLYTHHEKFTIVGLQYPMNGFLETRISLNKEAENAAYVRFTEWMPPKKTALNGAGNGSKLSPASPASDPKSSHTVSPNSPPAMGPTAANGAKSRVGERGKDGTVRFMLQAQRARDEKEVVGAYFAEDEYEEVEEEFEVPITPPRR